MIIIILMIIIVCVYMYKCIYIYIYIYIYIHVVIHVIVCYCIAFYVFRYITLLQMPACKTSCPGFTIISTTYASEFHNIACLKHVFIYFVSSEILKCRLSKLLLDHPMNNIYRDVSAMHPFQKRDGSPNHKSRVF